MQLIILELWSELPMCISKSRSKVFKRKDERLIGLKSFADSCRLLPVFDMKTTLTSTQLLGIKPRFRKVLKISISRGRRPSRVSCNFLGKIPSGTRVLKGENDLIVHATFSFVTITSTRCCGSYRLRRILLTSLSRKMSI